MAYKISTGLRDSLMGDQDTITAATLAAVASTSKITDSGNGLLAAGFRPGDTITISGFTGDVSNNQITTVVSVASDGSDMVVTGTLVDDAAGESVTITSVSKAFKDIFRNAIIRIYAGTVPADADADEGAGNLLLKITVSSGAMTPGTATNGLDFDAIVAGVLSKSSSTWSGLGLATSTAVWWRMYDNGEITGLSTTAKRCQGLVGTTGKSMILSSTSIVTGVTTTLDIANFTMPANA
jgi:hypothetical protein